MRARTTCTDCQQRVDPCAACLAHGDDHSTLMIANQLAVHVRNEHGQERVQRAMLWLIDQTLNEYDRSKA
jgi:hypothetical protein